MYRPSDKLKFASNRDRFIPMRIPVNVSLTDSPPSPTFELNNTFQFLNYAKVRYNRENYKKALRSALFPMETKVLNFFPPKEPQKETFQETWPVKSRKKPIIRSPEIVLDMPDFDYNPDHHVTDWSSTNCLATIFQNEVHTWFPDESSSRGLSKTDKRAQNCVKWNGEGKSFAVGLVPNRLGVFDTEFQKITEETFCCKLFCELLCFEWVDAYLLTGCSNGTLKMLTSDLKRVRFVPKAHKKGVLKITTSCNKKFIATCGKDNKIIVWTFPELECYIGFNFSSSTVALAWHPWKYFLLAIGYGSHVGRVTLWNINTKKQVACEESMYDNSSVNCLTFNPISAELVVSYYVADGMGKGSGIIAVLANIDKVVEELHLHTGPIPYLLWGYKGEVLASASGDENLCMWDFFGNSSSGITKKVMKKNDGNSFGSFSQIQSSLR